MGSRLTFSRGQRKDGIRFRGVSLLEILIASIAGSVVLGGLAGIYMLTITSYQVTTRRAETLSYAGQVEDTLTEAVLVGPARNRESWIAPTLGNDGLPLWQAFGYDRVSNHIMRQTPAISWYPKKSYALATLETGLVYWWRNMWSAGHGRYLESNIYHLRLRVQDGATAVNEPQNSYALPARSFGAKSAPPSENSLLTPGDIATLINNPNVRQASQILAREVLDFNVQVTKLGGFTTGEVLWGVSYRRHED